MINHFDFFGFYNHMLVVACDEEDAILGYFVLRDGNALCQLYVYPKYRGKGLVHHLIWKAVELVKEAGFDHIWGVMYDPTKELYTKYVKKWGAVLEVRETPEERLDGQWCLRFYVDKITPDKKPKFPEETSRHV